MQLALRSNASVLSRFGDRAGGTASARSSTLRSIWEQAGFRLQLSDDESIKGTGLGRRLN
jgi:hypothetical protein